MSVHPSSLGDSLRDDLRRRWASGDRVLVESYFAKFPDLSRQADVLLELIESEYLLRIDSGDKPRIDEYVQRFPALGSQISRRLGRLPRPMPAPDETLRSSSGGHTVACPYCQAEVELATLPEDGVTQCTRCGRKIHILDDTISLRGTLKRRVGTFELIRRVGVGQFGEVWLAHDPNLRRRVAVKLPRHAADKLTADLFLREARATARLRHPNIVAVHEAGIDDGAPYIVSDFIEGITLRERMANRRFMFAEAAQLCRTLAQAVQHAHDGGIVHRDLKPGNVLLDSAGVPHIADFGLARHTNLSEVTITTEGDIVGTLAYMPPEQARGDANQVGPRSDVYSLGVMLYELLAGQRPLDGPHEALLGRILSEEPLPLRKLDPKVPADLETICLKAMAKLPADRYESAQRLADDLDRFLRGEPILAKPITWLQRSGRWTRRNALKLAAGGALAVASGAVGAIYRGGVVSAPPAAPPVRVRLKTTPRAEQVVFVPLDANREPLPERMVQAPGGDFAELELIPGDYLVIADVPGHGFHEVWRHVPNDPASRPNVLRYRRWKDLGDRSVELPEITIPRETDVIANMALIEGGEFSMGRASVPQLPPHRRSVPAFYLDATEVTIAEYRRLLGSLPFQLANDPPPPDHPMTYVSWEDAVQAAELAGKRLMDEAEYEYAATNGGTQSYPWGNTPPPDEEPWKIGPVGFDKRDQLTGDAIVSGLCSNVAEWTATQFTLYPDLQDFPLKPAAQEMYIIRGGTTEVIKGNLQPGQWAELPHLRLETKQQTWQPGLGFRCARSARARLQAADFGKVLKK